VTSEHAANPIEQITGTTKSNRQMELIKGVLAVRSWFAQ
jgi:hypothetical protein